MNNTLTPHDYQDEAAVSQYYDVGDRTLWNPSLATSRLFMSQVNVYEAEVGLSSGIGPMEADECQIDPTVFTAFVDGLLAWHRRTGHAVMTALSEGFIATVLVLAERAGLELNGRPYGHAEGGDPSETVWRAALLRKSREVGRSMPA